MEFIVVGFLAFLIILSMSKNKLVSNISSGIYIALLYIVYGIFILILIGAGVGIVLYIADKLF